MFRAKVDKVPNPACTGQVLIAVFKALDKVKSS